MKVLASPDVVAKLEAMGVDAARAATRPRNFGRSCSDDVARWKKVVADAAVVAGLNAAR